MNVKSKRTRKSSSDKSTPQDQNQKGLTLFDHIKHIQKVQDPNYIDKLTELDLKTFNHFMLIRGLSMNPALLDDITTLARYFNKISSKQFYRLLISFIPPEHPRAFHPWIKATKKHKYSKGLIKLLMRKFEASEKEAIDYANIFSMTDSGKEELFGICQGYGLTDKEVESLMSNDDE
jgi:hypothetical protein